MESGPSRVGSLLSVHQLCHTAAPDHRNSQKAAARRAGTREVKPFILTGLDGKRPRPREDEEQTQEAGEPEIYPMACLCMQYLTWESTRL
jgi:hypothetical protein